MLLIGSHALKYHNRLIGREPFDIDLISFNKTKSFRILNLYFENHNVFESLSTFLLFFYVLLCRKYTDEGGTKIVSLSVLKLLKLSCVDYLHKAKHSWDLQQLEDIKLNFFEKFILWLRRNEVRRRVEKSKNKFFNKYQIPRYFEHDYLHTLIVKNPKYLEVLKDDGVSICKERFNNLKDSDKVSLILEEAFVLALERELIPILKKNPYFVKKITADFVKTNTSNTIAQKWISRLSISGKLKDHPEFIAEWALKNYNLILVDLEKKWNTYFENLPIEFWQRCLDE